MSQPRPLEKAIQAKAIAYLESLPGCWVFKVHGGPMQKAGVPDIVGAIRGVPLAIEMKRPGENPTPLQVKIMRDMQRAGYVTGVARSLDDVKALIDEAIEVSSVK